MIKALETNLEDKVNQWLALPETTSDEMKNIEETYNKQIFPLSKEIFISREKSKIANKNYCGLILTVGTSPEPLILTISLLNPKKVIFLYTKETEEILNRVVEETQLKPMEWDKRIVSPNNPLSIYQEVSNVWNTWRTDDAIAVDITGGSKSMTSGLAMAGALIGLDILYVANEKYLPTRRRPRPGTEYLEILPNPYSVFGVLKEREGMKLLKRGDFNGAAQLFDELRGKVPDPRKFEILTNISSGYDEWDSLNFIEASDSLLKASEQQKIQNVLRLDYKKLETQAIRLQHLGNKMPSKSRDADKSKDKVIELLKDKQATITLIFTIYNIAERKGEQGKWDVGSLFLYRLIEIMAQRRLALHGIDTANPNYNENTNITPEKLLAEYNKTRKKLAMNFVEQLPREISLLEGYILLEALEDQYSLNKIKEIHWNKLRNQILIRNHSILAHGFVYVSKEQYYEFKETVEKLLTQFCQIENIDFNENLDENSFLINFE